MLPDWSTGRGQNGLQSPGRTIVPVRAVGRSSRCTRRTFLTGGIAATTAPALAGVASAQDDDDSDPRVETIEAGETFTAVLDDGDSLGGDRGLVIDVRATGAGYHITAIGSSWEVRNVAVVGENEYDDGSAFTAIVPDSDGIAVIDNVWLGHGAVDGIGIFVHPDHAGTLYVRRCHLSSYTNNGIYASAPGNGPDEEIPGQGGTVEIESCYSYNNAISGFRIGTPESSVRDSVVIQDRRLPSTFGDEKDAARAIWLYYGVGTVEDVDFHMADGTGIVVGDDGRSAEGASVRDVDGVASDATIDGNLEHLDGSVGSDPDLEIPAECPSTPQAVFEARVPRLDGIGSGEPDIESIGDPLPFSDELKQLLVAVLTALLGFVLGHPVLLVVVLLVVVIVVIARQRSER